MQSSVVHRMRHDLNFTWFRSSLVPKQTRDLLFIQHALSHQKISSKKVPFPPLHQSQNQTVNHTRVRKKLAHQKQGAEQLPRELIAIGNAAARGL